VAAVAAQAIPAPFDAAVSSSSTAPSQRRLIDGTCRVRRRRPHDAQINLELRHLVYDQGSAM
jgi:hypothetical protein